MITDEVAETDIPAEAAKILNAWKTEKQAEIAAEPKSVEWFRRINDHGRVTGHGCDLTAPDGTIYRHAVCY